MELKIDQWYLHAPARSQDPYSLVKITGFQFNRVEFETDQDDEGSMSVPQFTRTYTAQVSRRVYTPLYVSNPTYSDYYTLDLCECCFIALVNGEGCQCPEDDEACHPQGLMGKLEDDEVTPGSFAERHDSRCLRYLLDRSDVPGEYECDCERSEFSTVQCDGCGTYLAGRREKATGWIRRG